MDIVQQHFRPEFINRIDDIVVFHPLGKEQIRAIVDIQLGYLRRRLAERDIELDARRRRATCSARRASIRCTARGRSSARSSSSWRTRWRSGSCAAISGRAIRSGSRLPTAACRSTRASRSGGLTLTRASPAELDEAAVRSRSNRDADP